MKNTKYEYIQKTEDGKWYGAVKDGWHTEYDTISVFANSKKELLEQQKYFIKGDI